MRVISDQDLMRYADGDLPEDEAAIVAARLPHDADLRRRLDVFTKTRAPLAAVFDEILKEPVPPHLVAAIIRTKPRADAKAPRAVSLLDRLKGSLSALVPDAVSPAFAASLALAVALAGAAGWIAGRSTAAPTALIASHGGDLFAAGTLAETLETSPSTRTASADGAAVTPVLSFRSTAGGICREYRIQTGTAHRSDFAGLGCREPDGQWRIAVHAETMKSRTASGEYQTAGINSVEAVDAFVATIIAGDALGAADETALLGNGWQTSDGNPGGVSVTP